LIWACITRRKPRAAGTVADRDDGLGDAHALEADARAVEACKPVS